MTIVAWRIFKRRHRGTAFTGEGARQYGGRWNSIGMPMVYAAGSCALAALELLVHLDDQKALDEYLCAVVTIDEKLVREVTAASLPRGWKKYPAPPKLQAIGDQWAVSGASAVLKVPSVIIEMEHNYLLNPAHPDFARIGFGQAKPFRFDPRLMK